MPTRPDPNRPPEPPDLVARSGTDDAPQTSNDLEAVEPEVDLNVLPTLPGGMPATAGGVYGAVVGAGFGPMATGDYDRHRATGYSPGHGHGTPADNDVTADLAEIDASLPPLEEDEDEPRGERHGR